MEDVKPNVNLINIITESRINVRGALLNAQAVIVKMLVMNAETQYNSN